VKLAVSWQMIINGMSCMMPMDGNAVFYSVSEFIPDGTKCCWCYLNWTNSSVFKSLDDFLFHITPEEKSRCEVRWSRRLVCFVTLFHFWDRL